jgi:hypothetical protein
MSSALGLHYPSAGGGFIRRTAGPPPPASGVLPHTGKSGKAGLPAQAKPPRRRSTASRWHQIKRHPGLAWQVWIQMARQAPPSVLADARRQPQDSAAPR